LLLEGLYIYILRRHKNEEEHGSFPPTQFIISIIGTFACFIPYGLAQEILFTHKDVLGSNIEVTIFLVYSAAVVATAVSFSAWVSFGYQQSINWKGFKATTLPGIASGLYLLASFEALKHLVYPTALLALACKLIPLANLETIRQHHPVGTRNYTTALLVGVGLLVLRSDEGLLTWGDGKDAKYGTALLLIAMAMKAMAGLKQDELKKKVKLNIPLQALYTDIWALITITAVVGLSGLKLDGGLALSQSNATFQRAAVVMCFSLGLGQLFQHYCVWHFNSMVASAIDSGRKLVSIVLSLSVFGYTITLSQFCGALLIFIGITVELVFHCCGGENVKNGSQNPKKVENAKDESETENTLNGIVT